MNLHAGGGGVNLHGAGGGAGFFLERVAMAVDPWQARAVSEGGRGGAAWGLKMEGL